MAKRIDGAGPELETFCRIDPFVQFGVKVLSMATEMEPNMAFSAGIWHFSSADDAL